MKKYKQYYAQITAIDEQIGRIIKGLEETNQIDNTIIVYTSDHGDMLGSHGIMNKQAIYDESICVPLIVYSKGQTLPRKCDELIGLVDLPVSLLALLGLKFPNKIDGVDLSDLFINIDSHGHNACYLAEYFAAHQLQWREGVEWRGIKTKKYSFCKNINGELELYDNEADEFQLNNVAYESTYGEVVSALNIELEEYIKIHDKNASS